MADDNNSSSADTELPFITHLLELRNRLLRAVTAVLVLFAGLFYFDERIYSLVAKPLLEHLPHGATMIATEVASPFLVPVKLTLVVAIFIAVPYLLYQLWAFVAPGLYAHEKKMILPLLFSSTFLFYLGVAFAYFIVMPAIFKFFTSVAPQGVTVMTDITHYLNFVLTLFFAFGAAFQIPIVTIVLVWIGVITPDAIASKRPYVVVGIFIIAAILTPPDIFSQTMLAIPMWVLFEAGVFFSRYFVRHPEPAEGDEAAEPEADMDEVLDQYIDDEQSLNDSHQKQDDQDDDK